MRSPAGAAALLSTPSGDVHYATGLMPGLIAIGLGVGMVFVPVSVTAMAGIPASHAGVASGFLMTGHEVGAALGVAILSAVAATAGGLATLHGVVAGFSRGFLAAGVIALLVAAVAFWRMPSTRIEAGPACTCTTDRPAPQAPRLRRVVDAQASQPQQALHPDPLDVELVTGREDAEQMLDFQGCARLGEDILVGASRPLELRERRPRRRVVEPGGEAAGVLGHDLQRPTHRLRACPSAHQTTVRASQRSGDVPARGCKKHEITVISATSLGLVTSNRPTPPAVHGSLFAKRVPGSDAVDASDGTPRVVVTGQEKR